MAEHYDQLTLVTVKMPEVPGWACGSSSLHSHHNIISALICKKSCTRPWDINGTCGVVGGVMGVETEPYVQGLKRHGERSQQDVGV